MSHIQSITVLLWFSGRKDEEVEGGQAVGGRCRHECEKHCGGCAADDSNAVRCPLHVGHQQRLLKSQYRPCVVRT